MAPERSAIVATWFGDVEPGTTLAAMVAPRAPEFGRWLELGLDEVRADIMPLELCLYQLPKRLDDGSRTFDLSYSPIMKGDEVDSILVIISDVTAQIERERTEREQREMVELFQRITSDRVGFDEFLVEAGGLVDSLRTRADLVIEKRAIHTLKGNCGVYGIHTYMDLCHDVEAQICEAAELTDAMRRRLFDGWNVVMDRIGKLVGARKDTTLQIERADLTRLVGEIRDGMSVRDIGATLASWMLEPIAVRLERLGRQAVGLGRRLGKGTIHVEIRDHQIRLESERWSGFWAAMIHAIRNAVDHGIEDPDARAAVGKPAAGTMTLSATREHGLVVVALSDDGRGIDWCAVRAAAEKRGLPARTDDDLTHILFADGVSTRNEATHASGRGVGLGALRAAVDELDGTIRVTSEAGRGTTFMFSFRDPSRVADRPDRSGRFEVSSP